MRRRPILGALAPAIMCALAALAAYLAVSPRVREGEGPPVPAVGVDAGRVLSAPARASSQEAFLADLDASPRHPDAGDEPDSVTWSDGAGVVSAAEGVLMAYRDAASFSLVTAGYLDLQGNAWGALVRNGTGSVDIVVVIEGADGAAKVTVSRLVPGGEGL
ncbi:MAG: hypothetical protein SOY67_04515 [Collinsella sp.]|nr:hypothetical protein [Collinsella sp.]